MSKAGFASRPMEDDVRDLLAQLGERDGRLRRCAGLVAELPYDVRDTRAVRELYAELTGAGPLPPDPAEGGAV